MAFDEQYSMPHLLKMCDKLLWPGFLDSCLFLGQVHHAHVYCYGGGSH